MFGIGSTELLVILIVALLVLGPKNLPKIAHTLGKALGEFRRVSTDFQRTLNTEIAFEEDADKHKQAQAAKAETTASTEVQDSPPIASPADAQASVASATSPAAAATSTAKASEQNGDKA